MGTCRAEGMIKNFNTIEDFRKADRSAMIKKSAQTVYTFTPPIFPLSFCKKKKRKNED